MAFKDITKVLYDGRIKLDYKDGNHAYYVRTRENWDLPEDDKKAWSKTFRPTGTTTLIENTLEKKGLLTWPLGLALRELFGFYGKFQVEDPANPGELKTIPAGFSKDVGTLWRDDIDSLVTISHADALATVESAANAWIRRQKKGADIGSVVHDAIEHYILKKPFDIEEQYLWNIKESDYEFEADRERDLEEFPADVEAAKLAFLQFEKWWLTVQPTLHGAEDLLYSEKHNVAGTYDADLSIPIAHHPKPEMFPGKEFVRCTTDWKTSNASKSKEAAMPEGINYQYFIQDAIYELMRREMGMEPADDLLVVSARKDGGFSTVYASELDLTVDDCIDWALSTITCFRFMKKSKEGLVAHAKDVA